MADSPFRHRWFVLLAAVLLLLAAVALPATVLRGAAQDAGPTLTLNTGAGQPGARVVATGTGFPDRAAGQLLWLPDGVLLTPIQTRGNGSLRESFAVPAVAPGDYLVQAAVVDLASGVTIVAEAPFRVEGAPAPTATDPPPATATATTPSTATVAPTATATQTATPTVTPTATATSTTGDAVLLAAGDIASCSSVGDEATAKLLDDLGGTVATLGDNVYESGTANQFADCYDPSWGRHKARTRPSAGNHDYNTAGAAGYFAYFGAAAGEPGKGYYSYNLGSWHVVVVNSNISMASGSAQEQWVRADLAASSATCTLAYWHHPRFSSGSAHGNSTASQPIWQALYDYGAEVVLVGHDHIYERFAPQTATGARDPDFGLREFVVGTGGKNLYGIGTIKPNSEVRNADTFGVLQLTLNSTGYDWQFVPEAGKSFTDSGGDTCHGEPGSASAADDSLLAIIDGTGRDGSSGGTTLPARGDADELRETMRLTQAAWSWPGACLLVVIVASPRFRRRLRQRGASGGPSPIAPVLLQGG